jgi:hypothetical protein
MADPIVHRLLGALTHAPEPFAWYVPSRSNPDRIYKVRELGPLRWRCECPAGLAGRDCWHTRACIEEKARLTALLGRDVEELFVRPARSADRAKAAEYDRIWGTDGDGGAA